ncbi:helix-turn-helix transcriptional regulator [Nocardiopsis sp. CC223A]|uniref:helix-turn-helix domain-containing protein n=1 Tax=Nocardiopsis sp. CC223A TaxID=3044051 RepID=UPI00278C8094|nr:helix-turn-helix transcriptional regulator [Nocardiopsis sp. CC223A]
MAKAKTATLRSRWLGRRLRELREASGMSIEEVGEFLQRNMGTVSRFENGIYPVRRPDMMAMLDLFGVNDPRHRENLMRLSESVWQTGWWDGYPDEFTEFVDFIWLEAQAVEQRLFDNTLLPGLLQTERYAESAIRAAEFDKPEEHIRQGLEVRLQRQQEILERETPPIMQVLLDESVLHRRVGSAEVMSEQLAHLLELSQRAHIELRLLPFSVGAHESPEGAFKFFVMNDPYPDVVYAETPNGALYLEQEEVAPAAQRYARLWDKSLSTAETAERISALIEEPS